MTDDVCEQPLGAPDEQPREYPESCPKCHVTTTVKGGACYWCGWDFQNCPRVCGPGVRGHLETRPMPEINSWPQLKSSLDQALVDFEAQVAAINVNDPLTEAHADTIRRLKLFQDARTIFDYLESLP